METKTNEPYYVYSCGKHRIARKTKGSNAPCSRCDSPKDLKLVATVPPEDDETDTHHLLRALTTRAKN